MSAASSKSIKAAREIIETAAKAYEVSQPKAGDLYLLEIVGHKEEVKHSSVLVTSLEFYDQSFARGHNEETHYLLDLILFLPDGSLIKGNRLIGPSALREYTLEESVRHQVKRFCLDEIGYAVHVIIKDLIRG